MAKRKTTKKGQSSKSPGRKPRAPQEPFKTDLGLSSALNVRWAKEVLDHSTQEQIADLLKQIRYRPKEAKASARTRDKNHAIDNEVAAYLDSSTGQKKLNQMKETVIKQAAKDWLGSPEGRRKAKELKTALLQDAVAADGDVIEHACRDRIQAEVDRWLRSPLGKDAVEQTRNKAIKAASGNPQTTSRSWVKDVIREVDGHD